MKPQILLKFASSGFAFVAALALVTGCQIPVNTESKPDVNFAAYRTFALLPLPQTLPVNDPGVLLRLAQPAQDATVEALTAKGYQPADRDRADFAVNLRGQSVPRVNVTEWGYTRRPYTYRYGRVPVRVGETEVRSYDEQTLAIEIFDNKSHEMVWTGWMKKESGGKITAEKLKAAIHAILAKFPPPPGQPHE